MRTDTNAGWRITFADIGEKKQHQQGSSLRKHVDAPVQKIIGIAEIRRETAIHVPARVSWIVGRRKSNWEHPEIDFRRPTIQETRAGTRSEEHTSELQSLTNLVCRLLLEKKKNKRT